MGLNPLQIVSDCRSSQDLTDNVSEDRFAPKAPLEATFRLDERSVRTPLSLRALTFSSGIPNQYEVVGLPFGQEANIALRMKRNVEIWKVKRSGSNQYKGSFNSEEAALAALQTELQPGLSAKTTNGVAFIEEEPGAHGTVQTVRGWRLIL